MYEIICCVVICVGLVSYIILKDIRETRETRETRGIPVYN
jgi:pseudouridine-5'-phosphate glycosidase